MSYATVWLNGRIVGGWPFGYASWRVDLTPYVVPGGVNQLAIRLDNPPSSSRWYPGGGIYRNVWLTKTQPVHVAQWGTYVTTPQRVRLVGHDRPGGHDRQRLDARAGRSASTTEIYALNADGQRTGAAVAAVTPADITIAPRSNATVSGSVTIAAPRLWGPPPDAASEPLRGRDDGLAAGAAHRPLRDALRHSGSPLRSRSQGVLVNGERIVIQGANQHHDLGALGAAFNIRAAERQLEILREMGCNAIRMSHNPPAPELLELTDRMGFLVVDEIFDVWERKKTPLDFHLIFPDWHEPDMRAWFAATATTPRSSPGASATRSASSTPPRRARPSPRRLHDIVREEDPTRPTTTAMNFAKPDMPFPAAIDVISLNYQGEGIRDAPEYADLQGIRTSPLYPAFHAGVPRQGDRQQRERRRREQPRRVPVPGQRAGSARRCATGSGGDPQTQHVSAYELYTAPFGSSADKVFASLDRHPYVAGDFVWSGWDYLGEPTPYYSSRSSYFGVIDLAGFKKDRFYLYQAHWRPDLPMAHILPHWTWPERVGQVTPVHVFTSGDEAELFLNGQSLGRKRKGHASSIACAGTTSSTNRERSRSSPTRTARSGRATPCAPQARRRRWTRAPIVR